MCCNQLHSCNPTPSYLGTIENSPHCMYKKSTIPFSWTWEVIMKTIMAVFLLLVSTSVLAKKPTECNPNANSHAPISCGYVQGSNAIPEPGSLALIGLGIAGLVIARRRKI